MATLVLQTAGQALGGAVAGPIGAAIGQAAGGIAGSIVDQALFGPPPRRIEGPRLNDLHVTGSTEGAPVPVVWGRARMAARVAAVVAPSTLGAYLSGRPGIRVRRRGVGLPRRGHDHRRRRGGVGVRCARRSPRVGDRCAGGGDDLGAGMCGAWGRRAPARRGSARRVVRADLGNRSWIPIDGQEPSLDTPKE